MKNRLKESRLFKNISKLGFIIIGCLVLASFSPSLDGRAVVVEPGVFPEGLFAKTVGYLPGDIISVTNITGDATIDILVIGALDPSEGVAIMLSPEAAAAIGINKDSNNIVKITKRSNQDERVYGSAVIASNGTAASTKEPEPVVQPEPVEEKTETAENQTPAETNISPGKDPYTETEEFVPGLGEEEWEEPVFDEKETVAATEPEEEIFSKPIEEPVEEEPVTEYEYFNDEALPEYFEDDFVEEKEPEYIEETPVEESGEEVPDEEEQPVISEEFKDDELDELPSEEEPVEEFETIPAEEEEEFEEEEAPVEEPEEEPVEETFDEEPIEEEFNDDELDEIPQDEEEFFDDEELDELEEEELEETEEELEETEEEEIPEEEAEDEFEEEDFDEEEFEAEDEDLGDEEFVEEEPEDEEVEEDEEWSDEPEVLDDDEEEYDAIVLVPAEDNPPVYEEEEEDSEPSFVPGIFNNEVSVAVDEPEEETAAPEITINNSVVVQPASSGNETSYDKYMVESLDELEAEKYYIQIATLKDDENILEIVNKYGSKYPITIVPTAKGTKQVLVGPVTLDEYGTVLARFKAYGYKDAFLRKGTNPNPKAKGSSASAVDAK